MLKIPLTSNLFDFNFSVVLCSNSASDMSLFIKGFLVISVLVSTSCAGLGRSSGWSVRTRSNASVKNGMIIPSS